jgi:tetratricopeptide (TPR) repeat protein
MTPGRAALLCLAAAIAVAGCSREEPAPAAGAAAAPSMPKGLAEAERALEEGRFGEAGRLLRAVDVRSLTDPDLRLRAARDSAKVKDFEWAARVLEQDAAGGEGRPAEAGLLRAEALVRCGRFEEAAPALAGPAEGTERGRYVRALLALGRGDREAAHALIESLVQGGSRDADVWVLWAQEATGDPKEMERRLRAAMERCADRATPGKALGRVLLAQGDCVGAAGALREAVRERPFDRDARLDLVRALTGAGRADDPARAVEEARRLLKDGAEGFDARLALAEALAMQGIEASRAAGDAPGAGIRPLQEAETLFADLAQRGAPDPLTQVRVLLGLARVLVEAIPMDDDAEIGAPTGRWARAVRALDAADSLDPEGRMSGPFGVRLRAEVLYLRGRAAKRAHVGAKDNTDSLRHYENAVAADPRHMEALWDLAMLYYDLLRSPEYVAKAADLFDRALAERRRRGLPPLPPSMLRYPAHARALAREAKGFEPGTVTPDLPGK